MYKAIKSRNSRLMGISNKLIQDYWRYDLLLYPVSKICRKKYCGFNVVERLKKLTIHPKGQIDN